MGAFENPTVSVVIPCYNYGRYLSEAVESVFRSTYPNIEVIIVNDGSTDFETLEVLNQMEKRSITVIHQPNRGLPAARNAGFDASRGKYVLPLDADDLIAESFLEIGVWLLERNPQISFIYSYVQLFGTENYIWYTPRYNFYELLQHNIIPATALVRKSSWAEVGGYDEEMTGGYEDWEFWIRLGRHGHTGFRVKDTLFFYRRHGPSMLAESNKSRPKLISYIRRKNRAVYKNPLVRFRMTLASAFGTVLPQRLARFKNYRRMRNAASLIARINRDVHYFSMKKYTRHVQRNAAPGHPPKKIWQQSSKTPVLIMLPWLEVGGVEQVFYNLISQLDRSQFAVYIITTLEGDNHWEKKFIPIVDGVFHLPHFVKDYQEAGQFVLDFIDNKGIRVVHISNSKLGYYLAPQVKKAYPELKVIDLLHMDEPDQPWDYFKVSNLVKEYLDTRVVITGYFKDLLVSKYGEKPSRIAVIPNGIDLSPFAAGLSPSKEQRIKEGTLSFAFVGRMHIQKEPLKFLQVARYLVLKKFPARFLMVGDGPLFSEVKEYIAKNKLDEHVKLLGFRDDVAALFSEEIDLLLAPSQREGLPVVGIEAMAAGVPVLASDVPGWDELVTSGVTGYLVLEGNVDGFVEYCIQLLNDRTAVLSMGQNARKVAAEKYDREKMARAYEEIYLQEN